MRVIKVEVGDVVRVKGERLDVYSEPFLSAHNIVCYLCSKVCITCLEVRRVQQALWICSSSGWLQVYAKAVDESTVELVDKVLAEKSWEEEKEARCSMAASVASALIRSYSLPRAKRLARSISKHAEQYYPHGHLTKITSESMEDVKISLNGRHGLSKQELFEFIKAAAARQSSPRHAVRDIAVEVLRIFTDRPSTWVVDNLGVLVTEDIRVDNNRFIMTAAEGNAAEFRAFLAHQQDLTVLHSELKYTALHAACDFGQLEIVRLILAGGMSANVRVPHNGRTPLHYAAYAGRPEVVEALIQAGGDRGLRCRKGLLPYECALKQGHEDTAELLKLLPPPVQGAEALDIKTHSLLLRWPVPRLDALRYAPLLQFAVGCYPDSLSFEDCEHEAPALLDLSPLDPLAPSSPLPTHMSLPLAALQPFSAYKLRVRARSRS
eukprot:gene38908-47328_t